MTRSSQTVHLCCAMIKTISRRTKMSFHLTHVTYEFHQVCPKRFSGQLYVWRKLCTYLSSRLQLSPKRLKWAYIWSTSSRSSIGCTQNDTSLWYVRPKPGTYVVLRLTLSPNRPKRGSTRPTSLRSSIGCAQNDFWAYCTLGANHEPIMRGDRHYLQMDQSKIPFEPHHLAGPSNAAKKISVPVVHSAQTVHLSDVKTNTVSK
jgi:hypothetical protein